MKKSVWLLGVIGALVTVAGVTLAADGAYLAVLGGVWFYLFAGILMCITGFGLLRRRFFAWPVAIGLVLYSVIGAC